MSDFYEDGIKPSLSTDTVEDTAESFECQKKAARGTLEGHFSSRMYRRVSLLS